MSWSVLKCAHPLPIQDLVAELKSLMATNTLISPYFTDGQVEFKAASMRYTVIAADKNVHRVNFWHCMRLSPRRVWDQVHRLQITNVAEARKLQINLADGLVADKFRRAAAYLLLNHMSSRMHSLTITSRGIYHWYQTGQQRIKDRILHFRWPKNITLYYGDPLGLLQRFPNYTAFVHFPRNQLGNVQSLAQALNASGQTCLLISKNHNILQTTFRQHVVKYVGIGVRKRILIAIYSC